MNHDWLNAIPPTWRRKKLKHVVQLMTERAESRPDGMPYVGLENIESHTGRLIQAQHEQDGREPDGTSTVNLFRRGDILFGKLRPYLAKGWLCEFDGACTTEALVLRPVLDIDPTYLLTVLLSQDFIRDVDTTTFGSKMPRADWGSIGNLEVPVPPLEDQKEIVAALDRQAGMLDQLIFEKRRLLHLLAEKRRVLITYAVTRGLNPDVSLLDYGIPWRGAIPAHWTLLPLRRLITSLEQGWSPVASNLSAEEDEYGVLKLSAIKGGRFLPAENKALAADLEVPANLAIRKDDVFITRANTPGLVGDIAVSTADYPNLIFSDLIYRVRTDETKISPDWLVLALLSDVGRGQVEAEAKGSSGSMVKLSQDQMLSLLIPVPPKGEQQFIAAYVRSETMKLRASAEATKSTIALLQERRSALISAAVTGQLSTETAA